MALLISKLVSKIALTNDVFELHYEFAEKRDFIAGQFMTFILPWVWGRSYSILEMKWNKAILVIKRWSQENGGRGGSIVLCDSNLWDEFKCVWPVWHFVLTDKKVSRLFIGTGTGLVPLYSQILEWLKNNTDKKYQLVFWVRHIKDLFYIEKFESLKTEYPDNFYYHLVVSRDEAKWMIHSWYVTDFITENSLQSFEEFYLCWAPAMIESTQEKLLQLWVSEENIFFEKYV